MFNEPIDSLPDILIERECSSKDVSTSLVSTNKNVRNILPQNCSVCGNRAVGYHYDVATCNGCKAFFRRTVITGKRVKCKKGNNCLEEIEPISRRVCPGCRFAKCEEVGMNPMAIRAEITANGRELKEQLLVNRESEKMNIKPPIQNPDELNSLLLKLENIENQLDNLFNSNLPSNYGDLRQLSEIIKMHPILEVSKIPNLSLLSTHAGFVHNMCLSVVEFTKMFGSFSQLSHDSVLKLIKHGASMCGGMMMSRRSIQKFNSDILLRTDGSVAGKPSRSWNGVWVEHKNMIQKVLHSFLRNKLNDVEYLFLKAVVICNPAVPDLPIFDQTIIEKERFRYARSLLSYCLKEYGKTHGPNRFSSILSMMSIMETQQKEEKCFYIILRAFYSEADVLISPLYDEIMSS